MDAVIFDQAGLGNNVGWPSQSSASNTSQYFLLSSYTLKILNVATLNYTYTTKNFLITYMRLLLFCTILIFRFSFLIRQQLINLKHFMEAESISHIYAFAQKSVAFLSFPSFIQTQHLDSDAEKKTPREKYVFVSFPYLYIPRFFHSRDSFVIQSFIIPSLSSYLFNFETSSNTTAGDWLAREGKSIISHTRALAGEVKD